MNKPLTPTQLAVAQWQARQPAFTGKATAQQLPGKAERRQSKAALVRRASGK